MDLTPLRRHRDFRWLYVAQTVSFLGTMVTSVALPYQMFQRTHSSLSVGLLGVAELLPLLTTAFIGGALADAWDRKRIVMMCHLGLGAGTGLMALNALREPPVWTLYVAAAWLSALNGLQRPSLESMGQRLVDREEMAAMAALGFVRGSLGMIAGPALGGMLIASGGVPVTYLFDVATYVFSLATIARLRIPPADPDAPRPSLGRIVEGFRYARSRQELIGTYVVDFVAMIFGLPMALFPALSERMGGAVALGPLYAAPAVGAFVASVTSGWTGRVHRHGYAVLWAAGAWGLAIIAFGFTDRLLPALFFLAVAGGADAVSGIFRGTIWNQTIPQSLRGRLVAIEMVSYMSGPLLGHAEAGLVAAVWGLRASVVSGGVLCVVGVIVCGVLLPRFVHYDARERPASGAASP
jgi:MFS family permease